MKPKGNIHTNLVVSFAMDDYMKTLSYCSAVTALAASLALTPTLSGAGIIVFDRATFQAAVAEGSISQQNFDSLSAGTILGATADLTFSASLGSPIVTNSFLTSTNPNGLGSTSAGFFLANETATFSFNAPITAFAIDVNTFANANGSYTASLNTGDIVNSIFQVFPGFATGQFIGFISDTPFSSLTIAAVTGFPYTLDTLVYGDARAISAEVPEPTTIALFGLGLVGMGYARRRKAS